MPDPYEDLLNHQEWRANGHPPLDMERSLAPDDSPPLSLTDNELLEKAKAAKGKTGADFGRLHEHGDMTGFTHPDGSPDPSKADFRYFSLLAFWCGRDPAQMERIGRTSALYRPERWDSGNYLARTIQAACARCSQVYTGTPKCSTGGGNGTAFMAMFGRMLSHKEFSLNRRVAFMALVAEYQGNLHRMDADGFVPICYRYMAQRYILGQDILDTCLQSTLADASSCPAKLTTACFSSLIAVRARASLHGDLLQGAMRLSDMIE